MTNTFTFSDGVLHITTPLSQMRLQWIPAPAAEERVPGTLRWKPFCPEFRIVRPPESSPHVASPHSAQLDSDRDATAAKTVAFEEFRRDVPAPITDAVARFQSHQWLLMLLAQRQPAILELSDNNAVLAYCLANNDWFRGTKTEVSLQLALGHSRQKQRAQLEWLGFPGTEAMVRLFRRIPPEAATPSLLRRLRNAIAAAPAIIDLLAHVPLLNTGVLELVVHEMLRAAVTPKLLLAVSRDAGELATSEAASQIAGALQLLQEMKDKDPVRPMTTLVQVRRFQEQVDLAYQAHLRRQEEARLEAMREQEQARRRESLAREERRRREEARRAALARRPFPTPPVPGTDTIIPLTSAQDLSQEGELQSNCVGAYSINVVKGYCYIYRVLAPERATLSVVKGADGSWRRAELKGRMNRKIGAQTVYAVDAWLAKHRLSV